MEPKARKDFTRLTAAVSAMGLIPFVDPATNRPVKGVYCLKQRKSRPVDLSDLDPNDANLANVITERLARWKTPQ